VVISTDNNTDSKDPAFLFYSSDFLTGVIDMTMEERGQYITLMCLQHQKGHLSEKTIRFCLGSVSVSVMDKFMQDENGLYFNKRLEEEIFKRKNFIDSRRKNGQKGGRPRKPLGFATENLPENENENENENIDIPLEQITNRKEQELARVMRHYMDRINPSPSPMSLDALKNYTEQLSADVVIYAIDIARDEKKTYWSYIQAILRRYASADVKSLADVQALEDKYAREKDQRAGQASGSRKSFTELAAEMAAEKRSVG